MRLATLLLSVIVICGALALARISTLPPNQDGEPVFKRFVVSPNTTSRTIAQRLYQEGLIRSPSAFLVYLRVSGKDRLLKAGEYQLPDNFTLAQLIDRLYQGDTTYYAITIPEGFTIKQIADALEEKNLINRDRFFEVVEKGDFQYEFLSGAPAGSNRLEGYLFPATYNISADLNGDGTKEKEILDSMLKRFNQFLTPEIEARRDEIGITTHDLVTMASLVEREARKPEEQPIIAGVLYNRIKAGMLLQIDATVQYALGKHQERLYYKDLEVESPYNTYLHAGLPPGPIASPGEGALKAVLYPAEHKYYYYRARPDGSHVFSRTLEEHNQAKREYGN